MKKILLIFLIWLSGVINGQAQDLRVSQFDFATSIENREPAGVDSAFTSNVGDVFCFTRIRGISDATQITHVWYYKDEEKARITLDVQSEGWRTWSSKKILPSWTGRWRVMVEDSEGNVLATKTFVVQK